MKKTTISWSKHSSAAWSEAKIEDVIKEASENLIFVDRTRCLGVSKQGVKNEFYKVTDQTMYPKK